MKICILAAGKGTRMGSVCKNINKSLLPLNNKAIISHIIEKFPNADSFVIGLGYKADQVKSYLKAAHPDKKFEFVKIKAKEAITHLYLEAPGSCEPCEHQKSQHDKI